MVFVQVSDQIIFIHYVFFIAHVPVQLYLLNDFNFNKFPHAK